MDKKFWHQLEFNSVISTRILIDLTKKFWFVYFQPEFQLIQSIFFSVKSTYH